MKQRNGVRWAVYLVMLALVNTALAGCYAVAEGQEVQVDASRNGTYLELAQGATLVVSLDSNPTTGYRWVVASPEVACLGQSAEPEFSPRSERLGGGGVQTFRFQAVEPGATRLELAYQRIWEKGVPPAREFTLNVAVR